MNMRRYDWGFRTEPEPHLGGRMLACPRGKVIGGSSSINGMVYVRGHPQGLRPLGGGGGVAAGPLPTCCPTSGGWRTGIPAAEGGDPSWRGQGGPLKVTRGDADQPADPRLRRGRHRRRLRRDARLQRRAAGGVRAEGRDDLAGAAVLGRDRLPAPGAADRAGCGWCARWRGGWCSRAAGRPASRSARRPGPDHPGAGRGHRRRLGDQLAEAPDAVGDRAGGRCCAEHGIEVRGRPAGRGRRTCRTIWSSTCR